MKTFLPLRLYLSMLLVMGFAVYVQAQTRNVSTAGADAGNCVSSPCLTIGYALQQANSGDAIQVAAGTYTVSSTININKTNITIDGAGPTTIVTINNNNDAVFRQSSNGATLKDLTLTSTGTLNAGIQIDGASSGLTVDNVDFTNIGTPTGALSSFQPIRVRNPVLPVLAVLQVAGSATLRSRTAISISCSLVFGHRFQ